MGIMEHHGVVFVTSQLQGKEKCQRICYVDYQSPAVPPLTWTKLYIQFFGEVYTRSL